VVTRLYNNREAAFSVLLVPCRGIIRESNSEASSCRSTEEYKKSVVVLDTIILLLSVFSLL
jgi:hypothetical protein